MNHLSIYYTQSVSLLQQLVGRFLKADVLSGKSGNESPQIQHGRKNQMEDRNLQIGDKSRSHFSKSSEQ